MQITVFGANGKVGRLVVQEALETNFNVVAFVHSSNNLIESKNLKIIVGDVNNLSDVESAINGADAVVSALGSWGTSNKDILTTGMENIIPSMQKYGVKRIISLTGADASVKGENNGIISKLSRVLLKLFAKNILQDGEEHIQLLFGSDLNWTVVRSPVMNDGGNPNNYLLTNTKPAPWATINRNSVAQSMIELLNDEKFIKQSPYIQRTKK